MPDDRQRPDPRPDIELDIDGLDIDAEPRVIPASPRTVPASDSAEEYLSEITSPAPPPPAAAPHPPPRFNASQPTPAATPDDLPDALNIDLSLRKLQKILRIVGISVSALIVLALIAVSSFLALKEPTPGQDTASAANPALGSSSGSRGSTPVFITENLDQMRAAAEKFFGAKTIDDLLKHCRDPDRVRPLIDDYYSRNPLEPLRIVQFAVGDNIVLEQDARSGNHFTYVSLETSDYRSRTICMELVANQFKVDWESAVGYSEMNWADFLKQRPARPVMMRFIGVLTDYYNFEYSAPSTWVSLKITDLQDSRELYGFVRRNSPPHAKIQRILQNAPQVWLVAKVRFPENARSRNCVEIVEIVHDRWVMGLDVKSLPPLPSSPLDGESSPREGGQDLSF